MLKLSCFDRAWKHEPVFRSAGCCSSWNNSIHKLNRIANKHSSWRPKTKTHKIEHLHNSIESYIRKNTNISIFVSSHSVCTYIMWEYRLPLIDNTNTKSYGTIIPITHRQTLEPVVENYRNDAIVVCQCLAELKQLCKSKHRFPRHEYYANSICRYVVLESKHSFHIVRIIPYYHRVWHIPEIITNKYYKCLWFTF